MSARLNFKRGDTFDVANTTALVIQTPGGEVSDFTGWSGASQIRSKGGALVATLTFEWIDASAGLFRVHFDGSTDDWPVATLECDIQFESPSGAIVSTETFLITVLADQTRPE
jgi:hypothetical protein